MMRIRFFDTHRKWEDWVSMLLGVLIGLSPWLSGQMGSQAMMLNAILVGAMVFILGEYEAADLHRWQEAGEIALGSWLPLRHLSSAIRQMACSGFGILSSAQRLSY